MGCPRPAEQPLVVKEAARGAKPEENAIGRDTGLTSANDYLTVGELAKFQPGRAKTEILEDVQWRGALSMAGVCNGQRACAIEYLLFSAGAEESTVAVWAIFVDEKFVKFVAWESGLQSGVAQDDPEGLYLSRPKPMKVGDSAWLSRQVERDAVSADDLREQVKADFPAPEQIDVGLTIAFLLLRPALRGASESELRRNAVLRDQFNPARLRIGMTESEVEFVLGAAALESGSVTGGTYRIYGSRESFDIVENHFANILLFFRDGKLRVVHIAAPGEGWRRDLWERFSDLPGWR